MADLEQMIAEQAGVCEVQARALAMGTVKGPRASAARRLAENVATLTAWINQADAEVVNAHNAVEGSRGDGFKGAHSH
jgi:hypothetical protein